MAEGDIPFEHDTIFDDNDLDTSRLLEMRGDDMTQHRSTNLRNEIAQVTQTQKAKKVQKFFDHLGQQLPDYVSPSDFQLDNNNRLSIDMIDSTSNKRVKVQLTKTKNPDQFYAWSTLKSQIPVSIRRQLGLPESRMELRRQAVELQDIQSSIPSSETINLQEMSESALEIDTKVKQMVEGLDNGGDMVLTLRELQGLDNALQTIRGELVLNISKLGELDRKITKQKNKLVEADDANLGIEVKEMIEKRLADLYVERSARLEVIATNRENMRSQFARIRETVHRILNENTTLAERIRTLFREQGITIFSILTAIGMTISTIVLTVTRAVGIGGGGSAGGGGGGGSQVKDWVKKALQNIAKLIKSLGEKLSAALPGIIGSLFSWLFSSASKVVNWAADHLWSLFIVILLALLKIIQGN